MNRPTFRPSFFFLLVILAVIVCPGCRPPPHQIPPPSSSQTETLLSGPITLEVTLFPLPPRHDRLLFLDFHLSHPADRSARIPNIEERLEGFHVLGLYERPAEEENGRIHKTIRLSVLPSPAPRHRIRPLAVEWHPAHDPTAVSWEQTPPLTISLESLPLPSHPYPPAPPISIPRDWKDYLRGTFFVTLGLLLLALVLLLIKVTRSFLQKQRLSPRERALRALDRLLERNLVETGRFREFYFELTDIVRHYIEESTGIRAPEQTTEEFLETARTDPRFPPDFLTTLQEFLLKADLVKYANLPPTPANAQTAVTAARAVIETPLPLSTQPPHP